MDVSADELAGLVDLFDALTRAELRTAAAELAFKAEGEFEPDAFDEDVAAALRSYHLLEAPAGAVAGQPSGADADPAWLVPGPLAYPTLPDEAADLPHILDAEERTVDREAVARAAEARFLADAARAVEAGDPERVEALRDASYELETWGGLDLGAARDRLDAAAE